jgi:hypothetical protein
LLTQQWKQKLFARHQTGVVPCCMWPDDVIDHIVSFCLNAEGRDNFNWRCHIAGPQPDITPDKPVRCYIGLPDHLYSGSLA